VTGAGLRALLSIEHEDGLRCVDIVPLSDGTFVFREFRRDPEDRGGWSLVADFSDRSYATAEAALRAAASAIGWFEPPEKAASQA
jgi:hypothetical protein